MSNLYKDFLISELEPIALQKGIALSGDLDFIASGLLDSLALLEVIETLERHFKTELEFSQMAPSDFTSIDSLVNLLQKP